MDLNIRVLLSRCVATSIFCLATPMAVATEVSVVGLFPGKAVISVDGGPPKTLSVGASHAGVRLLEVSRDSATLDIDGRRTTLQLGQLYGGNPAAGKQSVTLTADGRGHFVAQGLVNGRPQAFIVDTGASIIILSASDAARMGIDYRNKGQAAVVQTANGTAQAFRITLDTVRVGDIALNNVEAGIMPDGGLPGGVALLGMSFLSRMEIRHTGQTMVLTRRF